MSNEKSVALKGGLWTSVSTAVSVLTQFARLMILTRFLEKSDFGIVSIVNMVIGLCVAFTDLGFSSALMYKTDISQKEFSTLFWIQFIFFGLIYLVLLMFSPWIAVFYEESLLSTLIPIASLTIIFQSFGKLYDTVLLKQYKFKTVALRNITSNLISLLLSVIMAFMGCGVYSLIYSALLQTVIVNVWNFLSGMKIIRVNFYCSPHYVLNLLKIGIFQTGTRILDFFSDKIDVLIIGKLLGTEVLGLYDLVKNLVFSFVELIRQLFTKVAMPILSNNNNDDNAVRIRFLILTKIVAYICIPICIVMAIFSKEILWIVYGSSYIEASSILTLFAFVAMFNSLCSIYDMLGIAKGRTDLNFYNTISRILITIPIIFVTSLISIQAVAFGQLLATVFQSIVFWIIVVHHTYPISIKTYFSQFSKLLTIQLVCFVLLKTLIYLDLFKGSLLKNIGCFSIIYLIISLIGIAFLKEDVLYFKSFLQRKSK